MTDHLYHNNHQAIISYSSEDEVFYGKISEIDDLVTFEAASLSELKKAFLEAVDDYVETCQQLGKTS